MNAGKSYNHIFQEEPFPWQTGDPFWDGFKITFELQPQPDGEVETVYHVQTSTLAQFDRFLELIGYEPRDVCVCGHTWAEHTHFDSPLDGIWGCRVRPPGGMWPFAIPAKCPCWTFRAVSNIPLETEAPEGETA